MPHTPPKSDLWSSQAHAGTRFLALDGLDCLILEKKGSPAPSSAETAKTLSTLGSIASEESVFLLNGDNRLEAMVDLNRSPHFRIEDFSGIRAVMMAPRLSHRLGKWTRQNRRSDGLWSVAFDDLDVADDPFRATLERQILRPWIEGLHEPAVLFVAHHNLLEIGAAHHRSLAKYCTELQQALEVVWRPLCHAGPLPLTKPLFSDQAGLESQLARAIADSLYKAIKVQNAVVRTLSDEAEQRETKPETGSDVEAVVAEIENATEAVNALSETLSSAAAETRTAVVEAPEASGASISAPDPIQNAIEIRDGLLQSVKLVDAAKWAKWRGAKSKNPSAALGKYKSQHRLFAVRAGNRDLYPAFQFSENAEPLPIIKEILDAVPEGAQGWPLLSWFEAKNVLLRGRKPSDLVSSEPSAVLDAAARFYSRDD